LLLLLLLLQNLLLSKLLLLKLLWQALLLLLRQHCRHWLRHCCPAADIAVLLRAATSTGNSHQHPASKRRMPQRWQLLCKPTNSCCWRRSVAAAQCHTHAAAWSLLHAR
jgi:hypothetical protein